MKSKASLFSFKKIIKPLASLKLAVFIIIAIGVITALGTFVEAKYDAYAAKKLVYETFWMDGVMILLIINLTAVMVDRWPWRVRHLPFLAAHIGIILLLLGGLLTSEFGLDGMMRVGIMDKAQHVTLPDTDLVMWATFDGDRYTKVFEKPVDFFTRPPEKNNPFVIPTNTGEDLKILDYVKYAVPMRKVVESQDQRAGEGLRFQLKNANVNAVEWLIRKNENDVARKKLGLAQISFGEKPEKGRFENEIFLKANSKGQIEYTIFHKDSHKPFAQGVATEGSAIPTGWMGMDFKLLRYLPRAKEEWDLQIKEAPTPLTTSALRVQFRGQEHWLLQNDILKFFTDNGAYLLAYQNRKIDLGFPIFLQDFKVTHYKGTMKAMEYESVVSTPDIQNHLISMNEPMKTRGFTFYQASFESDETGRPVASVLSVNQDPGRWLKYLGSLVMSIGIILLFWFKKIGIRKTAIPMVRDPEEGV